MLGSFRFPSRLYPIVDPLGQPGRDHIDLAAAILAAGAPLIQLRAKSTPTATLVELGIALRRLTHAHQAKLIINDRADVARLVDADGVHLGREDLPVTAARAMLGRDKIVGLSTHNATQVEAALRCGGVDYLGFGPIYATASKRDTEAVQGVAGLRTIRGLSTIPVVAIGGIDDRTLPEVLAAGADAVAMISAICRAPDVTQRTRELLRLTASADATPTP